MFAGAAEVGRFQRLPGSRVDGVDGFAAASYRRLADRGQMPLRIYAMADGDREALE